MEWLTGSALFLVISLQAGAPPDKSEVLALPSELVALADQKIAARAQSPERRLDLLIDFIADANGLGFSYRSNPTHTVRETFEHAEGNCLSFTLMFMSLARQLDLKVYPREVRVPLAWQDHGQTVFEVGHVNVGVETPSRHTTVDFDPDLLRSQRLAASWRGHRISEERALAHFYNNRAAELLTEGAAWVARAWLDRALELEPDFLPALNTYGVVERRLGNPERALARFEQALNAEGDITNTLMNLVSLSLTQGNAQAAGRYRQHLESLRPDDPWFQWTLGQHEENSGRPADAARYYRRAVGLSRSEPRFQAGLARVLFELGDTTNAFQALVLALQSSPPGARDQYQAKLEQLKKISSDWP